MASVGGSSNSSCITWGDRQLDCGYISSIKVSIDDNILVAGSGDGALRVWDVRYLTKRAPLAIFVNNAYAGNGGGFAPTNNNNNTMLSSNLTNTLGLNTNLRCLGDASWPADDPFSNTTNMISNYNHNVNYHYNPALRSSSQSTTALINLVLSGYGVFQSNYNCFYDPFSLTQSLPLTSLLPRDLNPQTLLSFTTLTEMFATSAYHKYTEPYLYQLIDAGTFLPSLGQDGSLPPSPLLGPVPSHPSFLTQPSLLSQPLPPLDPLLSPATVTTPGFDDPPRPPSRAGSYTASVSRSVGSGSTSGGYIGGSLGGNMYSGLSSPSPSFGYTLSQSQNQQFFQQQQLLQQQQLQQQAASSSASSSSSVPPVVSAIATGRGYLIIVQPTCVSFLHTHGDLSAYAASSLGYSHRVSKWHVGNFVPGHPLAHTLRSWHSAYSGEDSVLIRSMYGGQYNPSSSYTTSTSSTYGPAPHLPRSASRTSSPVLNPAMSPSIPPQPLSLSSYGSSSMTPTFSAMDPLNSLSSSSSSSSTSMDGPGTPQMQQQQYRRQQQQQFQQQQQQQQQQSQQSQQQQDDRKGASYFQCLERDEDADVMALSLGSAVFLWN